MKQNNLYSLLDLLKERQELYIGDDNFTTLCNNINGYRLYCHHNSIVENLVPSWENFQDFVAEQLNYYESTSGYMNMILERNDFNEQKSLMNFYLLLDAFRK